MHLVNLMSLALGLLACTNAVPVPVPRKFLAQLPMVDTSLRCISIQMFALQARVMFRVSPMKRNSVTGGNYTHSFDYQEMLLISRLFPRSAAGRHGVELRFRRSRL